MSGRSSKAVKATIRGHAGRAPSVQEVLPMAGASAANRSEPAAHRGSRGSKRGLVHRESGDELDRFTAYLPIALGTRLRERVFRERLELSATIGEAVTQYLDGIESLVTAEQRAQLEAVAVERDSTLQAELASAIARYLRADSRRV